MGTYTEGRRPLGRPQTTQQRQPGAPTRFLLAAMILAIGLSPRIRLGGLGNRAVDLRLQDLLLVIAIAAVTLSPRSQTPRKMRRIWGDSFLLFAMAAGAITLIHSFGDTGSPLIRFAVVGRTIEMFLLAATVAGLYLNAGPSARRITLRSLHFIIVANSAWVAYQYVTGTTQTLFGDVAAGVYGPQLIGEPSAFGAGAFFVFTAALGLAEYRSRITTRRWAAALIVVGAIGAALAESRVSLMVVLLIGAALIIRAANNRRPDIFRLLLIFGPLILLASTIQWNLTERFTMAGLERSLGVRVADIWGPIWDVVLDNPLLGIGPGGLGSREYPWTEAHNIVLRALADHGLIGAILFFAIFIAITRKASAAARVDDFGKHLPTYATATFFLVVGFAVAGIVQDTYTAVTSTHLMMLMTGLFAGEHIARERIMQEDEALPHWRAARHQIKPA